MLMSRLLGASVLRAPFDLTSVSSSRMFRKALCSRHHLFCRLSYGVFIFRKHFTDLTKHFVTLMDVEVRVKENGSEIYLVVFRTTFAEESSGDPYSFVLFSGE